jgi:uncharacterized protein (TIGR02996 family)
MQDEQSWLARIIAAPRDDGLRLEFATGLEGHGDSTRAELIRAQIALARPRKLTPGERASLRLRERALRRSEAKRLLGRLPVLSGVTWHNSWERGLVSSVSVKTLLTLRDHAEAIFTATVVRTLCFSDVGPDDVVEFLERPEVARLRGLYFYPSRDNYDRFDEIAGLVARSSTLVELQDFGISGSTSGKGLTDEGARILADSPHLTKLRRLYLANNGIGSAGVVALAASPHLTNLRSLDLLQNQIDDEGLIALANSSTLTSLRSIQIYGNKHTDRTIRALVRGPLAANFRELWVGGGRVTERGARAIARTPALSGVRILDLNNTHIGDAGLIEIANSRHLRRVRELYLRSSGIGEAGIAVLARSVLARSLRLLDIENNPILDVGAWELVRSPRLEHLQKLQMWDCDNLEPTVCRALKERFGDRVEVHVRESEEESVSGGVHQSGPTTGDALLEDIRRHPDDDGPRLVYADWIEENGEPDRAEFIRLQCGSGQLFRQRELEEQYGWDWTEGAFLRWLQHPPARCPLREPHVVCEIFADAIRLRQEEQGKEDQRNFTPRWQELERRLASANWTGEEVYRRLFEGWVFERGFIESARVDEALFLMFSPAVHDLSVVRHLELVYDENDLDAGERIIPLVIVTMDRPRLRELKLGTTLEEMGPLRALAAWRGLEELTALGGLHTFSSSSGGEMPPDEVVRTLARSRHLRNLERLELDCYPGYSDAAIDAVLSSPYLRKLKHLRIECEDAQVSPECLARFQGRFGPVHP